MNKIHAIALIIFLINPLNILAELSGYPGEIYALKVENQEISTNLTVKIHGDSYELIPLPFNKQGKTIKESRIIREAINTHSTDMKSDFNFIKPVKGIISSQYGKRRYINDSPRSPHLALDIAAVLGTDVVAPEKGRVILIGNFFYAGKYMIIDHGHGLLTSYSHLSMIDVNENQFIEKGQKVGEVGSTGRVTGPHLHWTVYLNKIRINPESIIQENFLQSIL
jgi:murein DD-endopeptidase MepM/ murein hydrolase activator NlpD